MSKYKKYVVQVICVVCLIVLFVVFVSKKVNSSELGVWNVGSASTSTGILFDTGTMGKYCEFKKNMTFTLSMNSNVITGSYKRESLYGGDIKLMLNVNGDDGTNIIGSYGKKVYFDGKVEDTIILSTGDKVMTFYRAEQ